MTATITAYRDGRFTTEPKPDWWDVEVERAADIYECEQGRFGQDEGGNAASILGLNPGRGRVVTFATACDRTLVDVWAPTNADFLDLMSTRVPSFIGLSQARPLPASLDTLCNAFIAYARHGRGKHIDRDDGRSETDALADQAYEARLMAAQEAGRRKRAGQDQS